MIAKRPVKLQSKIAEGPEGLQITISPGKVSEIVLRFGGFILAVMTGAWAAKNLTAESLVPALFAFLIAIIFIVSAHSRTVLVLKPGCLVARKEISRRIGWTQVFDAGELSDLRFWSISEEEVNTGIIFMYRGCTVRFGKGRLKPDEAEYIISLIKTRYPNVNVIPPESREAWKEVTLFGVKIGTVVGRQKRSR
jgi:hypothetical protein